VWQAVERLCKGIRDEQAEGREGENWTMRKCIFALRFMGWPSSQRQSPGAVGGLAAREVGCRQRCLRALAD
jgi:hypothetical protein